MSPLGWVAVAALALVAVFFGLFPLGLARLNARRQRARRSP